jgi:DNA-binding HxlR family transcriptional regulator
MANKMTKRDYFNSLLSLDEVQSNAALVDFINHELDLLAKKNSAERKPTAVQVANEGIKTAILSALSETPVTISELQKSAPELAELTNQRISALVRQLVNDGSVVRSEDKRKAYFALVK